TTLFRSVDLIHPYQSVLTETDRGRQSGAVRGHRGRIVTDVVAEIEAVVGRRRDAAGAGGDHAPDADGHSPQYRSASHEGRNVDVIVVVLAADADRRAVGVHRHAGRLARGERRG